MLGAPGVVRLHHPAELTRDGTTGHAAPAQQLRQQRAGTSAGQVPGSLAETQKLRHPLMAVCTPDNGYLWMHGPCRTLSHSRMGRACQTVCAAYRSKHQCSTKPLLRNSDNRSAFP